MLFFQTPLEVRGPRRGQNYRRLNLHLGGITAMSVLLSNRFALRLQLATGKEEHS